MVRRKPSKRSHGNVKGKGKGSKPRNIFKDSGSSSDSGDDDDDDDDKSVEILENRKPSRWNNKFPLREGKTKAVAPASEFFLKKDVKEQLRIKESERKFQQELLQSRKLSSALFRGKAVNPFFLGSNKDTSTGLNHAMKKTEQDPVDKDSSDSIFLNETINFQIWPHITQNLDVKDKVDPCYLSLRTKRASDTDLIFDNDWLRETSSWKRCQYSDFRFDLSSYGWVDGRHGLDSDSVMELRMAWFDWMEATQKQYLNDPTHLQPQPTKILNDDSSMSMQHSDDQLRQEASDSLRRWLSSWSCSLKNTSSPPIPVPEKKPRKRRKKGRSDDWIVDDSESEEFLDYNDDYEEDCLSADSASPNVFVIRGPSGSGKSDLVHSLASSLGIEVIEIGTDTSPNRSGAVVKKIAAEATSSYTISSCKAQTGDTEQSREKNSATVTAPISAESVIYFDEADLVFPSDAGFHSALVTLSKTSRRPLVLSTETKLTFVETGCRGIEVFLPRPSVSSSAVSLRNNVLSPVAESESAISAVQLLSTISACDVRAASATLGLTSIFGTFDTGSSETDQGVHVDTFPGVTVASSYQGLDSSIITPGSFSSFLHFLADKQVDFAMMDVLDPMPKSVVPINPELKVISIPKMDPKPFLVAPVVYSVAKTEAMIEGGDCEGWSLRIHGCGFLQEKLNQSNQISNGERRLIADVDILLTGDNSFNTSTIPAVIISDEELEAYLPRSYTVASDVSKNEDLQVDSLFQGTEDGACGFILNVRIDNLVRSNCGTNASPIWLQLHQKNFLSSQSRKSITKAAKLSMKERSDGILSSRLDIRFAWGDVGRRRTQNVSVSKLDIDDCSKENIENESNSGELSTIGNSSKITSVRCLKNGKNGRQEEEGDDDDLKDFDLFASNGTSVGTEEVEDGCQRRVRRKVLLDDSEDDDAHETQGAPRSVCVDAELNNSNENSTQTTSDDGEVLPSPMVESQTPDNDEDLLTNSQLIYSSTDNSPHSQSDFSVKSVEDALALRDNIEYQNNLLKSLPTVGREKVRHPVSTGLDSSPLLVYHRKSQDSKNLLELEKLSDLLDSWSDAELITSSLSCQSYSYDLEALSTTSDDLNNPKSGESSYLNEASTKSYGGLPSIDCTACVALDDLAASVRSISFQLHPFHTVGGHSGGDAEDLSSFKLSETETANLLCTEDSVNSSNTISESESNTPSEFEYEPPQQFKPRIALSSMRKKPHHMIDLWMGSDNGDEDTRCRFAVIYGFLGSRLRSRSWKYSASQLLKKYPLLIGTHLNLSSLSLDIFPMLASYLLVADTYKSMLEDWTLTNGVHDTSGYGRGCRRSKSAPKREEKYLGVDSAEVDRIIRLGSVLVPQNRPLNSSKYK